MTTDRRLNFRPRETDLAALAQIRASLADPAATDADVIRDAIHRHPAVCRPAAAAKPSRTEQATAAVVAAVKERRRNAKDRT
jgi:hypothetical protein